MREDAARSPTQRARRAAIVAIGTIALFTAVAACFDLFHSTADILTPCEIDARGPDCPREASLDVPDVREAATPPPDFCAWPEEQARRSARHACAWLGACETPMGGNAFGPCMIQAMLAYDCRANPNHRVRGKTLALWDCLSQANSCPEVDLCMLPGGNPKCSHDFAGCAGPDGGAAVRGDVRIECLDAGGVPDASAGLENCALWGQMCTATDGSAACTGNGGNDCADSGCFGTSRTELRWCLNGTDVGFDCAGNGAGRCDAFPDQVLRRWVACVADDGAGVCTPDASATCANGIAHSCPSGVLEAIDCDAILEMEAGCAPGPLARPFDWTSACQPVSGACSGDTCEDDGGLVGCARGGARRVSCAMELLGRCRTVVTDGRIGHAACTPPAR